MHPAQPNGRFECGWKPGSGRRREAGTQRPKALALGGILMEVDFVDAASPQLRKQGFATGNLFWHSLSSGIVMSLLVGSANR